MGGQGSMKNIAIFFLKRGMLKRNTRSGFQFLGSGAESVAEHIFRTTYWLCPGENGQDGRRGQADQDVLVS